MKEFKPPKIKCLNCQEVIYSKYPGQWVCCPCYENKEDNKGCYIDSTEYYTRYAGKFERVE